MKRLYISVPAACLLACITASLAIVLVLAGSSRVSAQAPTTPDCNTAEQSSYIGQLTVPKEQYDVYVRLGKRGQMAPASVFVRPDARTTECQLLGTIDASGNEWRLVGSWTSTDNKKETIFQFTSQALSQLPTANRPTIMLVSHTDPLCRPAVECPILLNGQAGYVRPGGTLLNQDSLHVLRVVNPADDTVRKVEYYVDNQIKYSTSSLQDFDTRYISSDKQALLRVVTYESGQRVFLPTAMPDNFRDSFTGFLFRFAHFNPKVVMALEIFLSLVIGLAVLLVWLHWRHRKNRWQIDHGLAKEHRAVTVTNANRATLEQRTQSMLFAQHVLTLSGIVIGVILLVWCINTFFVQAASVTGHSMENTYHDGTKVFVNKVSKTWAGITNREYVPKRGDVVVVRPVFGTADISVSEPEDSLIVKRVIALPGERVIVKNGTITVYNEENPLGFNPDKDAAWQKTMRASSNLDEYVDVTLDASELFVSGDNRPGSVDSRYNGPVTTQNILGTVFAKL